MLNGAEIVTRGYSLVASIGRWMHDRIVRAVWWRRAAEVRPILPGVLWVGLLLLLSGCMGVRDLEKPSRTAFTQLLLSQALERGLEPVSLPLPAGATILVEAVGLARDNTFTPDQEYARQVVSVHLARQGFRLAMGGEEATYRIKVLLQTLGTEQAVQFFGLPPLQSIFLPFPIPEIALYKSVAEKGIVRFSLNVFERATGGMVSSSPWYEATRFYSQYVVLFLVSFHLTDLEFAE